MKVGFMGLGIMGEPMSLNLARKGHELTVYNREPKDIPELTRLGAAFASTPRECARRSEVVILMLTGPEACEEVLFGHGGAGGDMLAGKTVINMSTVSVAFTLDLKNRLDALDCTFIDAPVSGSRKPAEDGSLVILAGGDEADIARYEPLLLCMGWKVVRCGPAGAGTHMKLAVNQLLAVMMAGLAEMMSFGEHGGLDPETMLDVVLSGPLSCSLFQLKRPMLENGEFPVQFPLKHMVKDLGFAAEAADSLGLKAPALHAVHEAFIQAFEEGHGEEDFAAVRTVL
ncbi:6-phosphogluconate dehydrogenase NAD-binding protein [Alkalidesulfovibrio alkalitolerans DSM 16529]|uniref:6-phosphogluconate dehydrogenase NAD-binding protein n=1 Tax=Alkalidesulfovibrio alkalitolerans DSM 16529 TaxID=1121439 RepID=S7TAQ9_9BACT|nr:NAD(P)-dependent oxidoreductase [Alkalidesulfovibrio alkalitolerans]EPR34212.1 6-phosphogluconate dehydrogenase NAD-binding protein [Alkalidesulfovibrio alkalitolerans DSM 16529]